MFKRKCSLLSLWTKEFQPDLYKHNFRRGLEWPEYMCIQLFYSQVCPSTSPKHMKNQKHNQNQMCIQKWSSITKITEKVKNTTGKGRQTELQNYY